MDKINESRNNGKRKTAALVTGQSEIAPGIFDLRVKTTLAEEAVPGQFVGICPADGSRILPRPISVCGIDRTEDILRFVYRVAGAGTEEFSGLTKGDTIDIIGMLGNGFPLKRAEGRKVFIIGGGIGLPPLLETARQIKGCRQIVLGYRNSTTFMLDEFRQYGTVTVATEDGSLGTRGNVLDAIKENGLTADVMFACGPMPMLRALRGMLRKTEQKLIFHLKKEWLAESGHVSDAYAGQCMKTAILTCIMQGYVRRGRYSMRKM